MIEANIWGMLFYGAQIEALQYLGDQQKAYAIHLYEFVGHVLVYIEHARKMLQALGSTGSLLVQVRLRDFRKSVWLYSAGFGWMESKSPSSLDDVLTFEIESSTEDFRERPDGVAIEILRYVFYSVDWPQLTTTEQLENALAAGYSFNNWTRPPKFRS